jgi:hypothetical protein
MTPTMLILIAIAAGVVLLAYIIRRVAAGRGPAQSVDLGAVSTRWLAELRRDDPWTR